ncbi:Mur ligase family protein [Patescibacteria group bacterium]
MVYATQIVSVVIVVLWLSQSAAQLLHWLYWIQVKEYRLDRFKALISSSSGRGELQIYMIFIKVVSIIFSLLIRNLFPFFLVLLIFNLIALKSITKDGLRRPVFTQRIKRIVAVSIIPPIAVFLGVFLNVLPFSYLLLTEVLLLAGPVFGIALTMPSVKSAKRKIKQKAQYKLSQVNPKVIGVTGSYGKSSTKEFIYQLIKDHKPALRSYKNHNTVFGLGRTIVDDLKSRHKYFIAEMGAYKRGEIEEIAAFIRPDIAVITGIEPQHLELFGSLENIKKAKFELVDALDEGEAVINVSSKNARDFVKRAKTRKDIKVFTYGLSDTADSGFSDLTVDMVGKVFGVSENGLDLEITFKGKKNIIKTGLCQVFLLENLLGAVLVSKINGLSWSEIKRSAKNIKPPERTTTVTKKGKNTVIDDSYNSTPKGFSSALELLKTFRGDKYVLTPGIIELGDETETVHLALAKKMKKLGVQKVFVTNKDILKLFRSSVEAQLVQKSLPPLRDGHTILIEGRVPDAIYKKII